MKDATDSNSPTKQSTGRPLLFFHNSRSTYHGRFCHDTKTGCVSELTSCGNPFRVRNGGEECVFLACFFLRNNLQKDILATRRLPGQKQQKNKFEQMSRRGVRKNKKCSTWHVSSTDEWNKKTRSS